MAAVSGATMRAAVCSEYGPPATVLKVVADHPRPAITSEQVLIKVHAASVNPIDYKLIQGDMAFAVKTTFPHVPGFDVSGVVEEVGSACSTLKVGDEVFADAAKCTGSLAEYVAVPEKIVALKPSNLAHVEAAALPLVGLTSYQALAVHGNLKEGDRVLILGGSGGTGTAAIQIAKALGAGHVATTSSNVEFVTSLGADEVINYREADWRTVLRGQDYDLIFDCVGGYDAWEAAKSVLKPSGVFVTIVGDDAEKLCFTKMVSVAGSLLNRKFWGALGYQQYKMFLTDTSSNKDLNTLKDLVESGKLRVVLDPTSPYTLDTVKEMFEKLMTHRAKGKLVAKIVQE